MRAEPCDGARDRDGSAERGQVLVLFALSLVAVLAMGGLVLDGGGAFAQRRSEQNAADLAAMAGATAYLNSMAAGNTTAVAAAEAETAARDVAAENGYVEGVEETSVDVVVASAALSGQSSVTVAIVRPHDNAFAGVIGQPTWDVGASATAVTGYPNGATAAMPIIFNEAAMSTDNGNDPWATDFYNEPNNGPDPNKDVPQDETQFNWTVFCTANGNPCNGNSNTVREIVEGFGEHTLVTTDMDIGPLNAGNHTTLFAAMEDWIGYIFPVAIVDDDGNMKGWAMFVLTGVQGSSEKLLQGHFEGGLNSPPLEVAGCAPNPCPATDYGAYVIQLAD